LGILGSLEFPIYFALFWLKVTHSAKFYLSKKEIFAVTIAREKLPG